MREPCNLGSSGTVGKTIHCLLAFLAALGAGCGSGSSNADARVVVDATDVQEAATVSPYCTDKPVLTTVTDLSGTWVARVQGAQTVNAAAVGKLQTESVFYVLLTIAQTGTALTLDGRYCDRVERDQSKPLVPVVVIPDAWAHTEKPVHRTGSFAPGPEGYPIMSLLPAAEVAGAVLVDPTLARPAKGPIPAQRKNVEWHRLRDGSLPVANPMAVAQNQKLLPVLAHGQLDHVRRASASVRSAKDDDLERRVSSGHSIRRQEPKLGFFILAEYRKGLLRIELDPSGGVGKERGLRGQEAQTVGRPLELGDLDRTRDRCVVDELHARGEGTTRR